MKIVAAVFYATIILADSSLAWIGSDLRVLSFQAENKVTSESHASFLLTDDNTTTITNFSLCLWFNVFYFRESTSYLCSYSTSAKDNNEMNLGIRSYYIVMAAGNRYSYGTRQEGLLLPGLWRHLCFVANGDQQTGTFYLDGELHREVPLSPRSILLNGSMVLGQEADTVGGGFQAQQSFSGLITGFNVFSRSLTEGEVMSLARCRAVGLEGDLVGWSSTDWVLSASVRPLELQKKDYCHRDKFRFTIFPMRMSHNAAIDMCASLKSEMALPRSPIENEKLYSAALPFVKDCQPQNHARGFLSLGTTNTDGLWTTLQGEPLNYTNFEDSSGVTKRRCATFQVPPHRHLWISFTCQTYSFCVSCLELEPVVVKMRGLCNQGPEDVLFKIEQQEGQMPELRGFTKYFVSVSDNTWRLRDMWTGDVIATNSTQEVGLPLGRREWRTVTNFTVCGKPSGSLHELSFSACGNMEYTCGEGTCIDLTRRCDLRVDCPDNSDETGCEKLHVREDYMETLPPPSPMSGPLIFNLSAKLHGLSKVDVRDMRLQVDIAMVISWFDLRVQYKNLKQFADLNYIKASSVWVPTVEFINADFASVHMTDPVLNVERMSPPEEDDVKRPVRDEIYAGGKNPLRLRQRVNGPFSCMMNLRNFPFDLQRCQLQLRLDSGRHEYLQWGNVSGVYLSEELLTEYEVAALTVDQQVMKGYSVAIVSFTMSRRSSFYITSAYLPTTMLLIISYASLFCPRENRDLRVLMALTTLLVLYSLYQQISDNLPKTSYIKAIDIWCFFCITFIFSQVVLHVGIDLKWPCLCPSAAKKKCIATSTNCPLLLARKFYAVVFLLFCIFYWSFTLTSAGHE